MGKPKANKRTKTKKAKPASQQRLLTVNDLPREILPTILDKLTEIQMLNCMNLNEEFHHACLDKLKSKDFDRAVLLAAGKIGNLAAVKAILEQPGAKQTCKDNHEFRCEVLKAAAASGNARLCELLVRVSGAKNFGALCDCGKKAIQAAFCEAASHCHENAAMYFYYNGASFKHPTYWDELCNAAKRNDVKCAKFLIGLSAGKGYRGNVNKVPTATRVGQYVEDPILHCAIQNNHVEMVEYLLENGADVNLRSGSTFRRTPIMMAWREEVTRLLLLKNPDLSAVDHYRNNVLHSAARENNIFLAKEVLKFFKEKKISINAQELTKNYTALHYAARCSNVEMVNLLIENGADLNILDKDGCSPLLLTGSFEVMRALMESGSDLHVFSIKKGSVLHRICKTVRYLSNLDCDDILEAALKAGVPLSATATSYERKTPLHLAASYGATAIVKRLIEAGADLNAQSTTGYTPLHLAAKEMEKEIVQLLLDAGAVTHIRTTTKGKLAKDLAYGETKKVFERFEEQKEMEAEAELRKAERARKKEEAKNKKVTKKKVAKKLKRKRG